MRYYFLLHKIHVTAIFELLSLQYIYKLSSSNTQYYISSLLVHLTYKTEFLVFPFVQPAATPSEHNTSFTRSQNLQTQVAAFLLYLSHTCSGYGLPVCHCSLVQIGSFRNRSWRDVM